MTFDTAVRLLRRARTAEDIFGCDTAAAVKIYRDLAKLVHPDRVGPGRTDEATEAFARLSALWSALHGPASVTSRTATYRLGELLATDELAEYRAAEAGRDEVVLKISRRPTDNDLFRREAWALRELRSVEGGRFRAYLPDLRDSFTYRDSSSGVDHRVNVLDRPRGMVSLAAVGAAYPDGLDPRDAAWMWRRLLVVLGLAHRAGTVHGAVVPDNILIQPAEHGLLLTNWCFAATDGEPVPAVVARYQDWYAPEIASHRTALMGGRQALAPATPGSDIYLATRCMLALMRKRPPAPLAAFARGCLLPAPKARPDDAWSLLAELDDVLQRTYGRRRFRPFALPATAPAWPRQKPC
jgi:serine/threonine protein kinase